MGAQLFVAMDHAPHYYECTFTLGSPAVQVAGKVQDFQVIVLYGCLISWSVILPAFVSSANYIISVFFFFFLDIHFLSRLFLSG